MSHLKAVTVLAAQGAGWGGANLQDITIFLRGVVVFALDFVRMTEGNVLDLTYEIWQ